MSDGRRSPEEFILHGAIIGSNDALLLVSKSKQSLLFLDGQTLELLHALSHLGLDHRKQSVSIVSHDAISDSVQSSIKAGSLDCGRVFWVVNETEHFFGGTIGDASESRLKVSLFEGLNTLEHSYGTGVEVSLSRHLCVGQEVNQCSFLDEFVLVVNAVEFKLLLCKFEVLVLHHFDRISPLIAQLSVLISRVGVVEDGELRAREPGEVFDLSVAHIVSDQEFVMPNHSTKPIIVLPAAKARDRVDGCNVQTGENQTASGPGQSLVMRRNLFRTNSLKEVFEEVQVGHEDWGVLSVIRMHISHLHVCRTGLVIVWRAIFFLVLRFRAIFIK